MIDDEAYLKINVYVSGRKRKIIGRLSSLYMDTTVFPYESDVLKNKSSRFFFSNLLISAIFLD